jgi:signal transduction histidine kinase
MWHKDSRWFGQLSLQPILVVSFLLQIFTAVGLVGYFSFKNGQQAVYNLAGQLLDKASQQVDDHLDSYLDLPIQLTQINVDTIANKELNLKDLTASGRYFWRQAKAFENLSYIGYALEDGTEAGAGRWVKGIDLLLYENMGKGQASDYIVSNEGKRIELLQSYSFNPLTESWYKDAVAAGKPIWSQIESAENGEVKLTGAGKALKIKSNALDGGLEYYVAISRATPFYDERHKLLGVTSVELALTSISEFLRRLKVSSSGKVFVMERNGQLVGSSDKYPILHKAKNKVERYSAFENPDPLIRTVAQRLQKQFNTLQAIQESHQFVISFNEQQHFVHITPWQDRYGLDWLLVVTVPESDFMAQVNENTRATFLLCLGALVVATILGIYTSHWIIQPIFRLSQAARAIANGQFNQNVEPPRVKELGILADTFNHMVQQLRESFTALEKNNEQLEQRVEERTAELQNTLQELQLTQAQMIQAEKMSSLGQMVAGVAHEINNPVNFIYGNIFYVNEYTQHLLELVQLYQSEYPASTSAIQAKIADIDLEFLRADLLKLLASMQIGAERIEEIVKSLRTFSRLDESEMKEVDIHEGIDSTLLILQHRFKGKPGCQPIAVIQDYGNLPLVECYAGQLNQVLMNILTNAIDVLEQVNTQSTYQDFQARPLQINIRTSVIDLHWVQIAIADNGTGMSLDVRKHIFDPFFTTKPVGKGTGLGMSVSYAIITQKHGGKLECFSTLGEGTEFLLQIPIRQLDAGMYGDNLNGIETISCHQANAYLL